MIFSDGDNSPKSFKGITPRVHTKKVFLFFTKTISCSNCGNNNLAKKSSGSFFKMYENYYCNSCNNVNKICVAEY